MVLFLCRSLSCAFGWFVGFSLLGLRVFLPPCLFFPSSQGGLVEAFTPVSWLVPFWFPSLFPSQGALLFVAHTLSARWRRGVGSFSVPGAPPARYSFFLVRAVLLLLVCVDWLGFGVFLRRLVFVEFGCRKEDDHGEAVEGFGSFGRAGEEGRS